jgi:adenylate cyclase class 1
MGSAGTLGESSRSDLDIWVIYHEDLTPTALHALAEKVRSIERWAVEMGVEAHLYLMHPNHFRDPQKASVDQEHCGSSQHLLLLEEFYRTAVLMAGCYPLWWLVPPAFEHQYEAYAERLVRQRFLDAREFVDLGGIGELPAGEFVGSALWHLHKSVESPYKSNLKMSLMAAYADAWPDVRPVALRLKQAVHEGLSDPRQLDPYRLMYERVEEHLLATDQRERLEWVRQCLYWKTGERLSRPDPPRTRWRRDILKDMVSAWGWSKQQVQTLDRRRLSRHIDALMKERQQLVQDLMTSYRQLSDLARRTGVDASISDIDLTVIGRKLYAAFERRPDKIDLVAMAHRKAPAEPSVTLLETSSGWHLLRGILTEQDRSRQRRLYQHRQCLPLLIWGVANGVIRRETLVAVRSQRPELSETRVRALCRQLLQQWLPPAGTASLGAYRTPARPLQRLVIVNFGKDPEQAWRLRGEHWISNRNDPLSFGFRRENLIGSLDIVEVSSWHEITHSRLEGAGLVGRWLDSCRSMTEQPHETLWFAPPGPRSEAIVRRLQELIDSYRPLHRANGRFVYPSGPLYCVLDHRDERTETFASDSPEDLLAQLAEAPEGLPWHPVWMDPHCMPDTPIAWLSQQGQAGVLRLFVQQSGVHQDIWVVDETGAVTRLQGLIPGKGRGLHSLVVFCAQWVRRKSIAESKPLSIEWFSCREHGPAWQIQPITPPVAPVDFWPVEALIRMEEGEVQVDAIDCRGVTFSRLEYGERLFAKVRQFIMEQRREGPAYPVYLTDLAFDHATANRANSAFALRVKWQIERRINENPDAAPAKA